MWISTFEKNEFQSNIWFSVYLFKQIRMQTFVMIRDDIALCQSLVYMFQLVIYQSLSLPWAFIISASPVKKANLH